MQFPPSGGGKSHPEVEVNLARSSRKDKAYLQRTRLLASPQPFQTRSRLLVELVGEAAGCCGTLRAGVEVAEEGLRRLLRDQRPRGAAHGAVGRDEQHRLALAVLGCEALEHRIGV